MDTLLRQLRDPNYIGQEGMRGQAADAIETFREENEWMRSSLTSLLFLAEAENSPLTNRQVASICKMALSKHEGN